METTIHELTAGYALDALEPAEREAYESHLGGCPRCQEELASFWEVTGALAVAADGPAPSPALRDRILEAARAEQQTVVPLEPRRRRVSPVLATVTAVAAAVAIGLGIYAISLNGQLDDTRSALSAQETAAAVLADPNATTVAMQSGSGRLVVAGDGSAVLVIERAGARPERQDLPGLGRHGPDARVGGNVRAVRRARDRADPAVGAGRRGRRGDGREGRRGELADAAARCRLGSRLAARRCSERRARSRSDSPRTLVRMSDLRPHLHELFGFDDFRPGQEDVVRAAVEGRDTLALMPTGSGKSLTYQLAAMLRPEPTLVLSPLIALMKDQVDQLPPEIAATATFVNSSLDQEETKARIRDVAAGKTRILYAAPERLRNASFVETLRAIGVGLVVIDEVHCVSMWGHDFRPDYLFIRRALEALGDPTVLGMTATATPAAATEIAAALGRELEVVRTSVVRPNLRYDVEEVGGNEDRLRILVERLGATERRKRDRLCPLARFLRARRADAARPRAPARALPRRPRGRRALARAGRLHQRPHPRCRRHDRVRDGDRQAGRALRLPLQLPGLARELRADGRPRRAGRRTECDAAPREPLRRHGRAQVRRRRHPGGRRSAARLPGDSRPRRYRRSVAAAGRRPRPAGARRDARAGRDRAGAATTQGGRCASSCSMSAPAPEPSSTTCSNAMRARPRPAWSGSCGSPRATAAATRRSPSTSARCSTVPAAPATCAIRREGRAAQGAATPLPADVAGTIVRAVERLTWPLGRRSLVAMLRGSVSAPPSARASLAFGALEAASDAEVKRWIKALEAAGALVEVETDDGFRVLHAAPGADLPSLGPKRAGSTSDGPADDSMVERLRSWRRERSREDGVPAYVVLHDATLRDLAATRPTTLHELAAVKGFGPTKIERYGDDVLAVVAAAT